MKLQRILIIILVMCLVVALEVVLMNHFSKDEAAPAPTLEPAPTEQAAAPVQQAPATDAPPVGFTSPPSNPGGGSTTTTSDTSSNNNTTQSAPTTPPATPAPTTPPRPTDPPTTGTVVNSGSFVSNTGVGMNTSISWQAADQDNGTTRIYITGDVNSYSLNVMGRTVTISFAGYSTTVTSSSISVPEGGMVTSHLFFATLDVPTGTAGDMTVSWDYNGEYSGTSISAVTATGYVSA